METNTILSKTFQHIPPTTRRPHIKRKYKFSRRTKRQQSIPTYTNLFKPSSIQALRNHQCSANCLNSITDQAILEIRQQYLPKSELEKNKWLRDYLQHNNMSIGSNRSTRWHIGGIDVCKTCWMDVTTVSTYKLKYCNRSSHGSTGSAKVNTRLSSTIAWLANFFNSICEKMPTKEEFHLPCFILWNDVNKDLNQYLTEEGYKTVTASYFTKVSMNYIYILFV